MTDITKTESDTAKPTPSAQKQEETKAQATRPAAPKSATAMFKPDDDEESDYAPNEPGQGLPNSIRTEFDLWTEEPQIIASEESAATQVEWCNYIHYLPEFNQVVHVTSHLDLA